VIHKEFTGKDVQFHEAANIFPLLDEKAFDELMEDIGKNGLRESIKIMDGLVLDGRNRYRACLHSGAKPRFEHVSPDDPIAYVLSLNLHRRHLSSAQSAMCAARAMEIYERQAKERQQVRKGDQAGASPANLPDLAKGDARDKAGKAFGVSGKSVDHATRVIEKGIPELAKAVDEGRMAVSTAALLATEEPEVQQKAISDPKRNRIYDKDNGKPKRSGSDGRTEHQHVASTNVQYAEMAVLQLERIDFSQDGWIDAISKVETWIEKTRKKHVR